MGSGRRTLRYESFDEVMPDVERLLRGHVTVGNWSLAQICHHVAAVLRRHVDLPASTPFDPSDRVPEGVKRHMLEAGILPPDIEAPAVTRPDAAGTEREEAEALRAAIAYYRGSRGPAITHRIFGPLTREEWDRFELVHLAHHLSFVVPAWSEDDAGGRGEG
ncbi:hypothetical protein OJF2_35800 [Aquisphaera giovannonii]|uniref:DinB superfamily protein n=1 Tax=Aquisphaera giovannonii TaxID=406548 RepID=A0A5B9W4J6_9BACT|nr:DUF1569 domain-containing protein [Aquisphaera giovannonii]QEH35035.1 hypothetical protein OJF2_35800 [Aquisphaera giovannonii]